MCKKSLDLMGMDSKKALMESPKGLLWEEIRQELDGSKTVDWR